MTIKTIKWFEIPAGIPAGFHNPDPQSLVLCLNYKDYNNLKAGVEPWRLTHEIAILTLIGSWESDDWRVAFQQGAQEMVKEAASNDEGGFQDGDFYGVFWVQHEIVHRPVVLIGLAYANVATPLIPVQGVVERSYPNDGRHHWVTPQFAVPLQVDVNLVGEGTQVIPRVSRYKRTLVI